MIELFNLPPIIGMLPLVIFIIMALRGKSQIVSLGLATVLCMVLSGTGIIPYSKMFSGALGSDLSLIGLIILMSSGLGKVLEQTRVSHTIVHSIVNKVGVKTEKKAIIVTYVCTLLICGLLGTLSGGTSIIAPIIIPVVAAAGLSKSTVSCIFHNAGEIGLIWGPLSPAVVALMRLIGMSYGQMMLYAALPFGIVWLVLSYIATKKVQDRTRETQKYEDISFDNAFIPSKEDKKITYIFIFSFIAFIVYGIMNKEALTYLPFVMLMLIIILGAFSKEKMDDIMGAMIKGMSSALFLFLLFLLFTPLFDMMTSMGAFEALADVFSNLASFSGTGAFSKTIVVMLGSLVGGFGVEGAAVVQMEITHQLFSSAVEVVGLNMGLWGIALLGASRVTTSIYPTANMLGQMGIARSQDIKSLLYVGWFSAIGTLVFIFIYSFIGSLIF